MPDFPAAIDLSTLDGVIGFRLDGVDWGDRSGASVSSAGDVNGDGFGDVIIGAYRAVFGTDYDVGESYVVFGKAGGFGASFELASLDGTNGFRLDGTDDRDFSGRSVSSAGDINGDGFGDIIIGAYGGDPGGDSYAGESYVVFGNADGFGPSFDLAALDGSNGFRIDGVDENDFSGRSVSSAGDVNGDGIGDIIIGAYGGDPGGDSLAGQSYVVFGNADGFGPNLDLASLDGTNGFRLDGIDSGDLSGASVNDAGDVNGDGFDDIIVGALGSDGYTGETYVVFGKGGAFNPSLDLALLNGSDGFHIGGIDAYDLSGFPVSSAGDVNGDGYDDIIIGALGGDGGSGESYVVFGKGDPFVGSFDLTTLDGSNGFRIDGVDAGDQAAGVSAAGDVNGDGFDDLIIGARYATVGGDGNAGKTYVVFGKADGFGASFDLASLDGANGFRLDGIDTFDMSGRAVSTAGDFDGDGFDDIIIGADFGDPGDRINAGESYLVFGREPTTAVTRIGAAGDQIIRGGDFDDSLSGVDGDDILDGRDGADRLIGGDGADMLDGGEGADVLDGGRGEDDMAGGGGDDIYYVREAGDAIVEALDQGYDIVRAFIDHTLADHVEELRLGDAATGTGNNLDNILRGSAGADMLDGLDGADRIAGGEDGDTLSGGEGADRLHGQDGDDGIDGGAGQDVLLGQGGDDRIDGGAGRDVLLGGDGADTFLFETGDSGNAPGLVDQLNQFSSADGDKIDLSGWDADSTLSGHQAFAFIGTSAFGGSAGELRVVATAGGLFQLRGDTDGDRVADFRILLSTAEDQAPVESDFIFTG